MHLADRALTTVAISAWSLLLPLFGRRLSLVRLARLAWHPPERARRDGDRERFIVRATWRASRVEVRRFPDNCLTRCLVAYRFLSAAGADPQLVIGLGRHDGELAGHAWVLVDGEPVFDRVTALDGWAPIVEFGPEGHPVDAERAAAWSGTPAARLPLR